MTIAELRSTIAALGADGGLIGPSIYDTAIVFHHAPPADPHARQALRTWILNQQRPDGGWGDPDVPNGRTATTLAVLLALANDRSPVVQHRLRAAIDFLHQQAPIWREVGDDIPLAAELIIPALAERCASAGLPVPVAAYAGLAALGARRRQVLADLPLRPALPITHSWEAWGTHTDAALLDRPASIGHSPAATAAWIASSNPEEHAARQAAHAYLEGASRATRSGVPGVVPTVWPYDRNEHIVSLYTILLAGVLDHPALHDVLAPQIEVLRATRREEGWGISDHFHCDGDLTSMAAAVLSAWGDRVDPALVRRYLVDTPPDGQTCLTYPREMQRSLSATAHAAHALALLGQDAAPLSRVLAARRAADGRMLAEKWHCSWFYLTAHTIEAQIAAGALDAAAASLPALLQAQHADGGWGIAGSNDEETAYALLGLLALDRAGLLPEHAVPALTRGYAWLRQHPPEASTSARWAAKEPYRPTRIVRVEIYAAQVAYEEQILRKKHAHDHSGSPVLGDRARRHTPSLPRSRPVAHEPF